MKLFSIISLLAPFVVSQMSNDPDFEAVVAEMISVPKPETLVGQLAGVPSLGKSTSDIGGSPLAQTMNSKCPAPEAISDLADMNRVNANEFARFRSCFMDKKVKQMKKAGRNANKDNDYDFSFDEGITAHDVHLQEYKMYVASPWHTMHRFVCGGNEKCWLAILNNHKCFSKTMQQAIRRCARRISREDTRSNRRRRSTSA